MDSKSIENIRICRNCDELMIWNYYEACKRNDYSYLVYGWDGWPALDYLPIDTKKHFDHIQNEWADITKTNKSLQQFETMAEYSDLITRADIVGMLLMNLQVNWLKLDQSVKEEYFEELKHWGFLFRKNKPAADEFKRLDRQLRASHVKIKKLKKEIEDFDSGEKNVTLPQVKAKIQRIIQMAVDLKKTSMTDWNAIIEDAISKKAA